MYPLSPLQENLKTCEGLTEAISSAKPISDLIPPLKFLIAQSFVLVSHVSPAALCSMSVAFFSRFKKDIETVKTSLVVKSKVWLILRKKNSRELQRQAF